jgi:hypothetical protein
METNDTLNQTSEQPGNGGGEELAHSDKMIGVFSEPSNMFEKTSMFPSRTKDWLIPILILFLVIAIIRIVAMSNQEVAYETKKAQVDRIEKMVDSGTLTREQGDKALEQIDKQSEFMKGPIGWVITVVSTIIFGGIFFFIMTGIYFLIIKFGLKGEGSYNSALVANGLTAYITLLQMILGGILTMVLGKMIMDTSLASVLGTDKATITGWLFAKVDPLSIWAYSVLSIGFAKMFKAKSAMPYFVLVFSLWIIGGLLMYFIAVNVPMLRGMLQ